MFAFWASLICTFWLRAITAVVPLHNGYVKAAMILNTAPVTDNPARPAVAFITLGCVPTKYISIIVKAGSTTQAAKAGKATATT
mmetsp:Transcript_30629/g.51763  ORF Transcript_30629/g.51763 Transcript_30629/m.51763 type:complete len:84 (+) Transcript_30629:260-511(+)